jgi:tRNA threonylcarbamoyladenosine biosynthesis protein TsaE
MVTFISHSPAETLALGESWGRIAEPGWVIGLLGDLGAGKTVLVKGIAAGLGIRNLVHSPTFTLVNEYTGGRHPLFHLDLYRLESREAIQSAGLEDYFFDPPGISVVEWFERWDAVPAPELRGGMGMPTQASLCGSGHRSLADPAPLPLGDVIRSARLRRVSLEVLGETERRVAYEDIGV